eukprot:jgi/Chrzof1/13112/Cz07g20100.t1
MAHPDDYASHSQCTHFSTPVWLCALEFLREIAWHGSLRLRFMLGMEVEMIDELLGIHRGKRPDLAAILLDIMAGLRALLPPGSRAGSRQRHNNGKNKTRRHT